ncbi:glutathione peroxidase-like [Toxorhynchites rutilus septentrionalis]|uniref:glutathione peroxidase-like n=1 Tax=Toxorhynchites rutilus septentrionalis TaxID=329112 RepID=UPI00247ACBEE|nr:glutathione peroxidase-like [Toxorhynchites rutilus septentrionalis]
MNAGESIFDFTVLDINQNAVNLNKYQGAVCIIVNISTKNAFCEKVLSMLAPLYKKYHNETRKDLNILMFPCFQFGTKESMEEIRTALASQSDSNNLQIGDVFAEIEVNGSRCIELYKFLKRMKPGTCGGFISSNFTMFVTNKNGIPIERFGPNVHPYFLEDLLAQLCD